MGRPHRFAGSRLEARTALPSGRILELGAAAADVAVGNRWDGRTATHLVASGAGADAYEIRGGLGLNAKHLDFRLTVTDAGDRRDVATVITWYRTMQSVIYGFIPMGRKTMLGHHSYLQFMEDLAQRIRAEDPAATVTVRKGEQVLVGVGPTAVAPAPVGAPGPAAAPAPLPGPTAPPPPGGRACASCATVAYDGDVYCGECGAVL